MATRHNIDKESIHTEGGRFHKKIHLISIIKTV